MLYTWTTASGWRIDFAIDFHQWMIGANYHRAPWPMWNVFFGPMRFGGWREFATRPVKA